LATGHYHKYIIAKETVETKVYLYTIRALAFCRYVLREPFAPPIDYAFANEYPEHQEVLEELVAKKKAGKEKDVPPADKTLTSFILDELNELAWARNSFPSVTADLTPATEFFLKLLGV